MKATDSKHAFPVAANILMREFEVPARLSLALVRFRCIALLGGARVGRETSVWTTEQSKARGLPTRLTTGRRPMS